MFIKGNIAPFEVKFVIIHTYTKKTFRQIEITFKN